MNLTEVEKLAIENLVSKNVPINRIKEILGKNSRSRVIEKFIKDSNFKQEKEQKKENYDYDHQSVINKMAQAGIHGEKALRLIQRALKKMDNNKKLGTVEVYNEAIRQLGPRELMHGEDKGVKIMTPEAAFSGDKNREKRESRSTAGSVFKPNKKE